MNYNIRRTRNLRKTNQPRPVTRRQIGPNPVFRPRKVRRNRRVNNNNNNQNVPLYRPLKINTGMKIQMRTQDTFKLKIKLVVPTSCWINTTWVIPIHPLFLNQMLLNQAINYTSYQINNVTIMTDPLVATTDGTAIAIGYTTHCTPITNIVAQHWSKITNLLGTRGMAHTSMSYTIPNKDQLFHPMVPVVPSDLPFTIFITSQTSGTDLTAKILPVLSLTLTFRTQYTGDEIDTTLSDDTASITTSNLGTRSSVVMATSFGFVNFSDVPNVDIGELIQIPAFPVIATDYLFPWTHNNVNIDPVNTVADRGHFYGNFKTLN